MSYYQIFKCKVCGWERTYGAMDSMIAPDNRTPVIHCRKCEIVTMHQFKTTDYRREYDRYSVYLGE